MSNGFNGIINGDELKTSLWLFELLIPHKSVSLSTDSRMSKLCLDSLVILGNELKENFV